jgi:hypothetical protein
MNNITGLRVQVYRNLHKNCFSVRHKGTVVAHVQHLKLKDCKFHVGKGRERVLVEKRKNVHAWVSGTIVEWEEPPGPLNKVYYDPYKVSSFEVNGEPVKKSESAYAIYPAIFL